jgi:uncharacterized protein YegL
MLVLWEKNIMRRLPVFFVLDCSESMAGSKLEQMEAGIQAIIRALRTDPHALETVWVSIIAFAGVAKTVVPLIEVSSFYPPKLPLGGGTHLGKALDALMQEIDRSVKRSTADQKGDWQPIIYLFTDGRPTDNPSAAIQRWQAQYARRATLMAVGLGQAADYAVLRQLTEQTMAFDGLDEEDFAQFIRWVSGSVLARSQSVGDAHKKDLEPPLSSGRLSLVKDAPLLSTDETSVTLVGRCSRSRKPYLMKYEQLAADKLPSEFRRANHLYHLVGGYRLEEDYFRWSDPDEKNTLNISTSQLLGAPPCPQCGNASAFAACQCGQLLCINEMGMVTCPWCNRQLHFEQGDGQDFDVTRGQG